MAGDPAEIIYRRRLKRHLNFWRIAGVVAVIVAVLTMVSNYGATGLSSHVARLEVSGIILNNPARDKALRRAAHRGAVKALIVEIDSPGGTFVGGEALYNHLRSVAKEKPVVAVMAGTATSAAYMAAIGTSRVLARNGTVTGSIGVIMQTADITGMLEKLGIKPETVKSSPLKAQPNPIEPFPLAAREATEVVVGDLFAFQLLLAHQVGAKLLGGGDCLQERCPNAAAIGLIHDGTDAPDQPGIKRLQLVAVPLEHVPPDWLEHGLGLGLPGFRPALPCPPKGLELVAARGVLLAFFLAVPLPVRIALRLLPGDRGRRRAGVPTGWLVRSPRR